MSILSGVSGVVAQGETMALYSAMLRWPEQTDNRDENYDGTSGQRGSERRCRPKAEQLLNAVDVPASGALPCVS